MWARTLNVFTTRSLIYVCVYVYIVCMYGFCVAAIDKMMNGSSRDAQGHMDTCISSHVYDTEIPTIIDPVALGKLIVALGSIIVGISVTKQHAVHTKKFVFIQKAFKKKRNCKTANKIFRDR